MTLEPFLFGAPWALAALAVLPALWWLMRATPPPPQRTEFPPTRLLEGLRTDDQSRERAPWWLVIFRALAAALLIVAFARPSLAPTAAETAAGGRTLIVIDDGWTAAPYWSDTRAAGIAAATQAELATSAGIEVLTLSPRHGDFNDDLTAHGLDDLRAAIRPQIAPEDVDRFLLKGAARSCS